MIINELPTWIPWFNIGASLVAAVFSLALFYFAKGKLAPFALMVASAILLAGASFQANIINIHFWTLFGTAGRVLFALVLVFLIYYAVQHNERFK